MALANDSEAVRCRKNGFGCPWHPFQFVAWSFVLIFTVSHYGFTVFYTPGYWRVAAFVVPGVVLIVYAVCTIVTSTIDPAERGVREKSSGKHDRSTFDRSVHKHVIEDQFCHICDVMVSANAKHCRICDKCVVDFDHHCLWLNTCVGSRNYRWFFTTLLSALTGAVLLFLYNLILFILFFADRESLRYGCDRPTNVSSCDATLRVFSAAVPDPVFPTITAVMFLLAAIAIGLVGHLTGFHVYLMCRGISTYDYILEERERKEKAEAEPKKTAKKSTNCWKRNSNRVTPSKEGQGSFDAEKQDDGDTRSIASCTSIAVDNHKSRNPVSIFVSGKRKNEARGQPTAVIDSGSSVLPYTTTIVSTASARQVVIDMPDEVRVQKSAPEIPFHLRRPSPGNAKKTVVQNAMTYDDDDCSVLFSMTVANCVVGESAKISAPVFPSQRPVKQTVVKNEEEEEEGCSVLSLMVGVNSLPVLHQRMALPAATGIADQVGKPASGVIKKDSLRQTSSKAGHVRALPPLAGALKHKPLLPPIDTTKK